MSDQQLEYIVDDDEFDARQNALVIDLVLAIQNVLSKSGLGDKQVAQSTGDIAFAVCNILDATQEMVVANEDDDMELPLIPWFVFLLTSSGPNFWFRQTGRGCTSTCMATSRTFSRNSGWIAKKNADTRGRRNQYRVLAGRAWNHWT